MEFNNNTKLNELEIQEIGVNAVGTTAWIACGDKVPYWIDHEHDEIDERIIVSAIKPYCNNSGSVEKYILLGTNNQMICAIENTNAVYVKYSLKE